MLAFLIDAITFPGWLRDDIFTLGPISVKWYGVAYVVGLFGAYWYAVKISERRDVWIANGATRQPETIPNEPVLSDLMFYCLIGIIVGGRLGYVTLYAPETFKNPVDVLKVWEGGMAFHGGFLGVVAAGAYASWRKKISPMRIGDMASIGAPIGLGLVRVTNFINQELYGRVTDAPWGFIFATAPDAQPRHPSQLYEAFLEGLVLFLILRLLTVKFKALTKPGVIFGSLMMFYGLFRFAVEFVREPDPIPKFGMLTRGMAYSLPMVVIGAIIVLWAWRRAPVSPRRMKVVDKKKSDSDDALA